MKLLHNPTQPRIQLLQACHDSKQIRSLSPATAETLSYIAGRPMPMPKKIQEAAETIAVI